MIQRYRVRPARKPLLTIAVALVMAIGNSGCSLFVMAGKMLMGDPMVPSEFRQKTGVNLQKDQKRLLIVCSSPEWAKREMPAIDYDLADGILKRLKRRGILVVESHKVARWFDDNGGAFDDPSQLAREFDTDFIAHIDLHYLSFQEENSPTMHRGKAHGDMFVYAVVKIDGQKHAQQVFVGEFSVEYPRYNPIPIEQVAPKVFRKQFLDQLISELSRVFHDYSMSETI